MAGRIDFRYDAVNDIVIATPHWNIETDADIRDWAAQYRTYFARFNQRKVDFIVVLDDFTVSPTIGARWGEARAKLLHEYVGHSVRVRTKNKVKLFVQTSAVRYGVGSDEAATIEDAIAMIKAARSS